MKIGIMSDSHDNMVNVRKAVEIFNEEGVEAVLHAGDIIAPFVTRELKALRCPVTAVFGNNDGELFHLRENFEVINRVGKIHEPPVELELAGRKIYLTHWPHQIEMIAKSGDYDMVVFGHTHEKHMERHGDTLLINPGETGGWLEPPSIAIVKGETLEARFIDL